MDFTVIADGLAVQLEFSQIYSYMEEENCYSCEYYNGPSGGDINVHKLYTACIDGSQYNTRLNVKQLCLLVEETAFHEITFVSECGAVGGNIIH